LQREGTRLGATGAGGCIGLFEHPVRFDTSFRAMVASTSCANPEEPGHPDTSLQTGSGAIVHEEVLMQSYESIFIVRPSLSDEDTSKVIEKMKGVVEKNGAVLLKSENWGKKKLAYEVKRERKGTFVYLHFKSEGGVVGELERSYRLEDSVIKFLTVRLEQEAPQKPANPENN
jgi:small subunit ribosomal protein S6